MAILGILTCEILELEFAHILGTDAELDGITVLDDKRSWRLIEALESLEVKHLKRITDLKDFGPNPNGRLEVLVQVLELALHNRKRTLQQGLIEAARKLGPYIDALMLGYGLCGNALEKPDELLSDAGVPVFIPMDEDHPVDDCVGLLIGGRQCYYKEQCKIAGTFFMIPGWTHHWRRMVEQEFGSRDLDLLKRLFKDYERSLVIPTPTMSEREMKRNTEAFNRLFGLRSEVREGTLEILYEAWYSAKAFLNTHTKTSQNF
ncbi:MAG: DUF1638 domain-containing protein [Deltaproteobacteria bacterium]|nr:MAG: DUF1638 domain-containing protein [Deltaproteobacteria bacterium]